MNTDCPGCCGCVSSLEHQVEEQKTWIDKQIELHRTQLAADLDIIDRQCRQIEDLRLLLSSADAKVEEQQARIEELTRPKASSLSVEDEKRIRVAVAFGQTQRTGSWFVADLKDLLSEIDHSRERISSLEQTVESQKASIEELRNNEKSLLVQEHAKFLAHRACCGSEHDASQGKLHGYCAVCGVPWPCDFATGEREAQFKAELASRDAALTRATDALKWIQTVNESLDLRKLDPKTVIGLVYELRGKAKEYFATRQKEKA